MYQDILHLRNRLPIQLEFDLLTHVDASLQMHASLAEVAAAKARMFVNKPDGSKLFLI